MSAPTALPIRACSLKRATSSSHSVAVRSALERVEVPQLQSWIPASDGSVWQEQRHGSIAASENDNDPCREDRGQNYNHVTMLGDGAQAPQGGRVPKVVNAGRSTW